ELLRALRADLLQDRAARAHALDRGQLVTDLNPWQVRRQRLAAGCGRRAARLTQWRGAQRGFDAERFGEFEGRFDFVEQATLTGRRAELLAAGAVLVGLQNSQRLFE